MPFKKEYYSNTIVCLKNMQCTIFFSWSTFNISKNDILIPVILEIQKFSIFDFYPHGKKEKKKRDYICFVEIIDSKYKINHIKLILIKLKFTAQKIPFEKSYVYYCSKF